jgi:tryptophan-rich sensory protein
VVAALLVAIVAFIALAWLDEPIAALLFAPYAAWTAFATLLNAAVWRLNPAPLRSGFD